MDYISHHGVAGQKWGVKYGFEHVVDQDYDSEWLTYIKRLSNSK